MSQKYCTFVTDLVWFWYLEMMAPPSLEEKKEKKEKNN